MKFTQYEMLSAEEQNSSAYEVCTDEEICNEIGKKFNDQFSNPKIRNVCVGSYGIGGGPVIQVSLDRGKKKLILPDTYLGFTVIRKYLKKPNHVMDPTRYARGS